MIVKSINQNLITSLFILLIAISNPEKSIKQFANTFPFDPVLFLQDMLITCYKYLFHSYSFIQHKTQMSDSPFSYHSNFEHDYHSDYQEDQVKLPFLPFTYSITRAIMNSQKNSDRESPQRQLSTPKQSKIQLSYSSKRSNSLHKQEEGCLDEDVQVYYQDQLMQQSQNQNIEPDDVDQQYKADQIGSPQQNDKESFQPASSTLSKTRKNINELKKKSSKSTPQSQTRNFLQYFWKVFKNYFIGKNQKLSRSKAQLVKMKSLWRNMNKLKPSLCSFTVLFKDKEMRPYLITIFKSRYLIREVVSSGMKQARKSTYLRYIKVLLKGFINQKLQYLN